MRILLTADALGGVWEYARLLAEGLTAGGHEVLLAVVGRPTQAQVEGLPPDIRLEARDLKLEWMADADADVGRATDWLVDLAERWGADVVHLNQMAYTAEARFRAPTLVVVHSDVLSWFSELRGTAPPPEFAPYRRWVAAGLAAATAVVAPTKYQAVLTRRHYGVEGVEVVHNASRRRAMAAARGERPLLLAVGRAWDEAKGISTLDGALTLLGDGAPEAHLLGPTLGPGGAECRLGRLHTHGAVGADEVAGWMGRATLFVAPSRYEPFGLAPLEAALAGCPLVLSDIGSFRELWDGCASFFPPGDVGALAERIAQHMDDPAGAERRAAAAAAHALERFGPERFVDRYIGIYRGLTAPAAITGDPVALERRL
jgi:glycogen synthase